MSHACMPTYGVQVGYDLEKRDHIAQNAIFAIKFFSIVTIPRPQEP